MGLGVQVLGLLEEPGQLLAMALEHLDCLSLLRLRQEGLERAEGLRLGRLLVPPPEKSYSYWGSSHWHSDSLYWHSGAR